MNTISSDILNPSWLWVSKNKKDSTEGKENLTPASADAVSLSPEAQALAAAANDAKVPAAEAAGKAKAPAAEPAAPDAIEWGPDLIQGWEDPNYLKVHDDGTYSGSLSLTNEFGTRINISAEQNEDGSAARTVMVTIQKTDGTTQQHRVDERSASTYVDEEGIYRTDHSGGYLRISETEEGIVISTDAFETEGKDGNDVIIGMGNGASGGKGNDTMVSLRGSLYGSDGDDTLVAVGYTHSGSLVSGGDGNDVMHIRNYTGFTGGLETGTGSNSIIIDNAIGMLNFNKRGGSQLFFKAGDAVSNDISIKRLWGSVDFLGDVEHDVKLRIGTALNSTIFTRNGSFDIEVTNLVNSRLWLESDNATAQVKNGIDSIIGVEGGKASIVNNMDSVFVKNSGEEAVAQLNRYQRWEAEKAAAAKTPEVEPQVVAREPSVPRLEAALTESRTEAEDMYLAKRAMLQNVYEEFRVNAPFLNNWSRYTLK